MFILSVSISFHSHSIFSSKNAANGRLEAVESNIEENQLVNPGIEFPRPSVSSLCPLIQRKGRLASSLNTMCIDEVFCMIPFCFQNPLKHWYINILDVEEYI